MSLGKVFGLFSLENFRSSEHCEYLSRFSYFYTPKLVSIYILLRRSREEAKENFCSQTACFCVLSLRVMILMSLKVFVHIGPIFSSLPISIYILGEYEMILARYSICSNVPILDDIESCYIPASELARTRNN